MQLKKLRIFVLRKRDKKSHLGLEKKKKERKSMQLKKLTTIFVLRKREKSHVWVWRRREKKCAVEETNNNICVKKEIF